MTGYKRVPLLKLLEAYGDENKVRDLISDFSCPLNHDVELFLSRNAIEFEKQRISSTHLIYASLRDEPVIAGYFSLALKTIVVRQNALSKTLRKRISKFGTRDNNTNDYVVPIPLIGQLSKNYKDGCNTLITGDELLKMACDAVREAQLLIGGRAVYLECEDKEKLKSFYLDNGFVNFGKRDLDKDELDSFSGTYLIQMLKFLR